MIDNNDDLLADLQARIEALEQRQMTQPSPWFWKNPLANKQQQNATSSTKSAVIQEFTTSLTDFTTTDTSTIHEVLGVDVRVPSGNIALFAFSNWAASHDIAAATYDAYLVLADAAGPGSVQQHFGIYLASAAQVVVGSLVRSLSNSDLKTGSYLRDRDLRLSLYVQNRTAGTLTIRGFSPGSSIPSLTCFVTGDSSL